MPRFFKALVASFPFFFLLLTLSLLSPSKALAATFTVTKTADTNDGTCDADCSLREAIAAANANAGHDTIEFDILESDAGYVPASGDVHAYWEIEITDTLALSDEEGVFINGYSQEGASRNTALFGETLNTVLTVQVFFNFNNSQLSITGDNNHLTGLNIRTLRMGTSVITLNDSSNSWFEGNFFGTDITGKTASNGGSFILNNSTSNVFGTNGDGVGDAGERNLFGGTVNSTSAGGYIYIKTGDGNVVAGNYLGTDKTGRVCTEKRLDVGAMQVSTSNNQIGTNYDGVSDSEEANLMGCTTSEAPRAFIRLLESAQNNTVQGNYIGISPHGDALGSLFGLDRGALSMAWGRATGNIIKGNTISNGATGIVCWGDTCTQNTFSENKIYGNEELDINLMGGVENGRITFNDSGDIDTGPNDLMNYPVIEHAEFKGDGRYYIQGSLDGNLSEAPFTIEVCKSSQHHSGYGGCLEPLRTTTTSGDFWSLDVEVSGDTWDNLSSFTALATNANGSTSEFGPNKSGALKPEGPRREPLIAKQPDFVAQTGGVVGKGQVVSVVLPGSFLWDVYLDVSVSPQVNPRFLGSGFWQASPVYEVWYKAFFNDAKVLPQIVTHPFILALKYDPATLDPNLPIANLKLAYSGDEGKTWSLLPDSVLDTTNRTVAILTKNGGHYMLVSGYTTRLPRLPLPLVP